MSVLKKRDKDGKFQPILTIKGKDGKDGKGFNNVIEVPEGEVAPQGIFEMEEGIYLLKGKFHYYPLDYSNDTGYNPVIDFEREVIAYVTKVHSTESVDGRFQSVYRTHLWYFDAAANGNTGSQEIIEVKYFDTLGVYSNSFNRTPNLDLERSTFKQRDIDDLFYSRLADEEGRTEFYPTLGVMADYMESVVGTLNNTLETILDGGVK